MTRKTKRELLTGPPGASGGHDPAAPKKTYKISRHAVRQILAEPKTKNLFSDTEIKETIKDYGIELAKIPDSAGMDLNTTAAKVFEGILKLFSETGYEGHTQVEIEQYFDKLDKSAASKNLLSGREDSPYRNIKHIPTIKVSLADISRYSGFASRFGDKTDVKEALKILGERIHVFMYRRLKRYKYSKAKATKQEGPRYEIVREAGTVFRIKEVLYDNNQDKIEYYEISPSAALIDQITTYYLKIPDEWRQSFELKTGHKPGKYDEKFCLWLREQYEITRNHNDKKNSTKRPYTIKRDYEDITDIIKMPQSMAKRNRKKALKIVEECCEKAQAAGYITSYVRDEGLLFTITLNRDHYPNEAK